MVLILLFLSAVAALAQGGRQAGPVPEYKVNWTTEPLTVDGRLNEPAWQKAEAVEFVFPWEFQTGAKQSTQARLLWDEHYLYAGYTAVDIDIVAHFDHRDDPTYRDDAVEIFLNPKPSQQDFYYGLEMNAKGVLYDYFYAFPKLLLKRINLRGVQLATNINGTLNQTGDRDTGWTLELAIPWENFEELAEALPPKPGDVWTANMNRWDGTMPNRRLSQWSDSGLEKPSPHNPARFGRLVFTK